MRTTAKVAVAAVTLLVAGVAVTLVNPEPDGAVYTANVLTCPPQEQCRRVDSIHIRVEVAGSVRADGPFTGVHYTQSFLVPAGRLALLTADQTDPEYLRCWWQRPDGAIVGFPDATSNPGGVVCHLVT